MKIIIRQLLESDIQGVVRLYSEVITTSYISYGEIAEGLTKNSYEFSDDVEKKFENYISGSISDEQRTVYVAVVDEKIAGFVCAEIKKVPAGHVECWISDLGVSQMFRRRGLAKKLLHEAYKFGDAAHVAYFFLESGYANHDAHHVFEKEGFKALNIVFVKPVPTKGIPN